MAQREREPNLFEELTARLRWRLRFTQLSLVIEAFTRAFWPFLTLLGFAVAAWLFGLPTLLEAQHQRLIVAAVMASLALVFALGLWRLRLPRRGDAARALDATLPGRPISAVQDRAANTSDEDDTTAEIWQAHQSAMFGRALKAKALPPRPRLAGLDRLALRLVAMTLLVAGLLFGTVPGLIPGLSRGNSASAAMGPIWEGWITPPAHSGLPARYLPDLPPGDLSILQGSDVSFRFYGDGLSLTQDIGDLQGEADQPSLVVTEAGALSIDGPVGRAWQVSLLPDNPPEIGFTQPPEQGENGQLELDFTASDDFGVAEAWAEIHMDLPATDRRYHRQIAPEPREAITLSLPLPIAGQRVEINEHVAENYSKHPFARLPVQVTLYATDATGQIGQSAPVAMTLPGRRFFAPMAAAVIEQRQALLWNRENAYEAMLMLRTIAAYEDGLRSETSRLGLRLLIERLERAALHAPMSDDMQSRLAEEMWRLAQQIEDGDLGDALERLRRARERLEQAMRDGATPEEIEELMQEYRDALREWMDELAQRSDGEQAPMPEQNGMPMTSQDLQDMMDEIQRLMEEGRIDEAMELLELLQQMLENMQVTPGGQGGQSGEGLSETLREQQELSDDAFRDLQQRPPGANQNNPGAPSGEGTEDGTQGAGEAPQTAEELAERQGRLRDELGNLRDGLPPPGTEEGDEARGALDDAGEAMDRAEEALREGDLGRTLGEQADAIREMRRALRAIDEANRPSGERAARAEDMIEGRESVDPLGRERNDGGAATNGQLGDALDPSDRARQLEQFLAERLGRRDLDPDERAYLEDLLERF